VREPCVGLTYEQCCASLGNPIQHLSSTVFSSSHRENQERLSLRSTQLQPDTTRAKPGAASKRSAPLRSCPPPPLRPLAPAAADTACLTQASCLGPLPAPLPQHLPVCPGWAPQRNTCCGLLLVLRQELGLTTGSCGTQPLPQV
jgi:hypothetical protein